MATDERLRQAKKIGITPAFNGRDSVSASDRNDLRQFKVTSRSSVQIALSGLKRGANADIELFSLKGAALRRIDNIDFDRLTPSQRRQFTTSIARSKRGGNANELLNATLNEGTYYLRVQYRSGRGRVNYNLSAAPTGGTGGNNGGGNNGGGGDNGGGGIGADGGGDTPLTATPIEVDFNVESRDDTVGDRDLNDYYSFNLADDSTFSLSLTGLSANADVELINVQTNETRSSTNPGTQDEAINLPSLAAGDYYIRVFPAAPGQNTSYRLTYSAVPGDRAGNTPAAARDITADLLDTTIDSPFEDITREFIGGVDDFDYYKITLPEGDRTFLSATIKLTSGGSLNTRLYREGDLTNFVAQAVRSSNPLSTDEGFGGTFDAGTYFLRVQPSPSQSSTYDLSLYTQPANGAPTISQDIDPGENASSPRDLTVVGTNQLFFVAKDATGESLWQADGRSPNVGLGTLGSVRKVNLGSNNLSGINNLVAGKVNDQDVLYFTANGGGRNEPDALWRTDPDGGSAVQLLNPTQIGAFGTLSRPVSVNNTLYFVVSLGGVPQLYQSNGTASETVAVPGSGNLSSIEGLTAIGDALYFKATDERANPNSVGREVWRITNPGSPGASLAAIDIQPGIDASLPNNFFAFDGKTYFLATGSAAAGEELWELNGTQARQVVSGNGLVEDSTTSPFTLPPNFTIFKNELYFTATQNNAQGNIGRELFKLTANGQVELVADLRPNSGPDISSSPSELTVVRDGVNDVALYFVAADDDTGRKLWRINDTGVAPTLVPDVVGSDPKELTARGRDLYFRTDISGKGSELFRVSLAADGTQTQKEFDILPGADSSNPSDLTVVLGQLFFSANNGTALTTPRGNGVELWTIG